MDIAVRDLKRRLSELLDRAARGEIIRVTDRGRPKALIGPLPGQVRLKQGLDEGWVRAAEVDIAPVAVRRVRAQRRSEDILAEDRAG